MSTTVKYKGNTLTTVSNATKTLKTAGKYMEGDVVLTDETIEVNAEAIIATPQTTAQTITPSTGHNYISQVTVNAIPYSETPNATGITVTIG